MTISFEINEENALKLINSYKLSQVSNPSNYVRFAAKLDTYSVILYTSNKVVFQGTDFLDDAKLFGYVEENQSYLFDYSHIGSDEVGTGDYFGPIIVASCYVDKKDYQYLIDLGIKDSKKLNDAYILKTVPLLLKKFPHVIMMLDNLQYNELNSEYNLNEFKAILHNTCLYNLSIKTKCNKFVVDQFCSIDNYFKYINQEKHIIKDIDFVTKGESKSISVALASMIARYTFLVKIDELNKKYNINIKLGSSKEALDYLNQLIKEKGISVASNFAKLNYKNIIK